MRIFLTIVILFFVNGVGANDRLNPVVESKVLSYQFHIDVVEYEEIIDDCIYWLEKVQTTKSFQHQLDICKKEKQEYRLVHNWDEEGELNSHQLKRLSRIENHFESFIQDNKHIIDWIKNLIIKKARLRAFLYEKKSCNDSCSFCSKNSIS